MSGIVPGPRDTEISDDADLCLQERVPWDIKDKGAAGARGPPDPNAREGPGERDAWNVVLLCLY